MATSANGPVPKIPNFIFAEKIGSGSYADVYKAYQLSQTSLGTLKKDVVAIKCILKTSLSKAAVGNLESEIKLLKKIKHEHIVEMKDFRWDDKFIYIIMEYCSGGDLSHFIKTKKQLPENICRRFLQQLASAMKYLREHNVSHFDLKPPNILLLSPGNPMLKICDFGLAQHMHKEDTISALKGSPLYMAPEIILKREYSAKVDIWSVGVILFECLFGRAPYSSKTFDELVDKIKCDRPIEIPIGTIISSECRDLLQRCLERDVDRRIEFDDFFHHPFVDLEHKPNQENMTKVSEILNSAVHLDQNQEYEQAFHLYTEALLYLVPALHSEDNSVKRGQLRRRIQEYMKRTEQLKVLISNENGDCMKELSMHKQQSLLNISHSSDSCDELLRLCSTTPQFIAALDISTSAALYQHEGSYTIALQNYQLALGKLLELLKNEPIGRRKELLLEEVDHILSKAEQLKEFMNKRPIVGHKETIERNTVITPILASPDDDDKFSVCRLH